MVWCPSCTKDCRPDYDHSTGSVICGVCAKIVYQDTFSEEPTFVKGPGGETRIAGSNVDSSHSYERTLYKGKKHILDLVTKLGLTDGNSIILAPNFYKMAVERSFTRGRRTDHVAAACLYIACRASENKPKPPYLLIDFAMQLSVNVYVLGAVFLQLCKVLNLQEHPMVKKPVDPTLFIHRFTSALLKCRNMKVTMTALHIVAGMKRDWMNTGRKPSGICGAALYIAALAHGFKFRKSDIVEVVHICEATLTKRLIEFENTDSASLTMEEFNKNAKEFKEENHSCKLSGGITEILCEHQREKPYFHGICRSCYADFVEVSGGLHAGSDPPAFQRTEMATIESSSNPVATTESIVDDEMGTTESLSDIDDGEVNDYLNSEEECRYKKFIWEEMNKEYLEEQAAKEASGDLDVAKSREKRRQKRAFEAKNVSPAQTAAEATGRMLTKKGLSSKINYDVLEKLFDDDPDTKRNRVESPCYEHHDSDATGQQLGKEEDEAEAMTNIEEETENVEEDIAGELYGNQYFENGEEVYDYGYDDYDGYH